MAVKDQNTIHYTQTSGNKKITAKLTEQSFTNLLIKKLYYLKKRIKCKALNSL